MKIQTAAIAILSLSLSSLPTYAADADKDTAGTPREGARINLSPLASDVDVSRLIDVQTVTRPATLPALYVSFIALQAFDAYSTRRGLGKGASEANPLMTGVVGNSATFWAVKAATTVGVMMVAERLWKTNKAGAIAVMVIGNSVAATVAARNASVLKQLR